MAADLRWGWEGLLGFAWDDELRLPGPHQLQTLANLEFLLGLALLQAVDAVLLLLELARQIGVLLLKRAHLVLLSAERSQAVGAAQGHECV